MRPLLHRSARCRRSVVSAASEEVSRNVASVATSAEEMNLSIREIARNAAEAAKIATSAVKAAKETNETVIRIAPPLVIERGDLDWGLEQIESVLRKD